MNTNEILTTASPRWDEFIRMLAGPEGLNFEEDSIKKCSSATDRPISRKILESMGNVDIEGTLQYFEDHGGYCECEILMNVDNVFDME